MDPKTTPSRRTHPAVAAQRTPPVYVRPVRPEDRVRAAPGTRARVEPRSPQDLAGVADQLGAFA